MLPLPGVGPAGRSLHRKICGPLHHSAEAGNCSSGKIIYSRVSLHTRTRLEGSKHRGCGGGVVVMVVVGIVVVVVMVQVLVVSVVGGNGDSCEVGA